MLSKCLELVKIALSSYDISVFCTYVDFRFFVSVVVESMMDMNVQTSIMQRRRVPAPDMCVLFEEDSIVSLECYSPLQC